MRDYIKGKGWVGMKDGKQVDPKTGSPKLQTAVKVRVGPSVHKENLSHLAKHTQGAFFLGEAGTEPYKLLANIARQIPEGEDIADLGTCQGASALALSVNSPTCGVFTYDIVDQWPERHNLELGSNIFFTLGDCLNHVEDFADMMLVHLDIDPHDGKQEAVLIHLLKSEGFKGLLIMDDIHLNLGMDNLWHSIALKKVELTKYGHWSGTGAVVFDPQTIDVEVE